MGQGPQGGASGEGGRAGRGGRRGARRAARAGGRPPALAWRSPLAQRPPLARRPRGGGGGGGGGHPSAPVAAPAGPTPSLLRAAAHRREPRTQPRPTPNPPKPRPQPPQRYHLGLLPTPVHRFAPPGAPAGSEIWIKRDDLSGMQMSGNKVGGGGGQGGGDRGCVLAAAGLGGRAVPGLQLLGSGLAQRSL
jgi:hypothetical protein